MKKVTENANAAEVESLSMLDKSDQWEIEANAILEKTVFAALKGGHSIYLFTQENIDSNAVSNGHFLDVRDVKFPTAFFSFMFLDSGEFSFSHSAFSGTRDLAVYETKDQFQTVAIKLAEAIQRGDEEFIFPTVEEVTADNINAELIACIDDYAVDVDAAAEVEIMNEILAHIDEYIIKPKVVTVTESGIKAAVSNYKAIGEHFDDIMDVAVDEGLPNWEREQEKLERRHYSAERKAKAKFVSDFFKTIGIPKELLKISVEKKVVVREGVKEIEVIYFEPKTEKINTDQLEKIAMYFENDYTDTDVVEFIDGYEGRFDVLDEDDDEIEIEILA